jgi:hypothetical protein
MRAKKFSFGFCTVALLFRWAHITENSLGGVVTVKSCRAFTGKQETHTGTHMGVLLSLRLKLALSRAAFSSVFVFPCIEMLESHCNISMIKISEEQA